jgi:hypothetical protein
MAAGPEKGVESPTPAAGPRRWRAVAAFVGAVMAAVLLGGPAYAATPHNAPTLSHQGPIGGDPP